jgi:hypothetical protein
MLSGAALRLSWRSVLGYLLDGMGLPAAPEKRTKKPTPRINPLNPANPSLGQIAGGAKQHRRVAVMAAGMHDTRVGGAVGEVRLLLDRKGVHIGTQSDGLARPLEPAGRDFTCDAQDADLQGPYQSPLPTERYPRLRHPASVRLES